MQRIAPCRDQRPRAPLEHAVEQTGLVFEVIVDERDIDICGIRYLAGRHAIKPAFGEQGFGGVEQPATRLDAIVRLLRAAAPQTSYDFSRALYGRVCSRRPLL